MAGSAPILTDSSGLSRADRLLEQLERFLALLGGIMVVGLMLLAVVSVGGRTFFNRPLSGYLDWIVQAMPIIAFLGIAMVQREGGHIRMDMLLKALSGRLRYAVEFFSTLVIFVLMLALVWGTWAHFERSFDATMPLWSRDSTPDINLPLWPAKLLVPLAFTVMLLRLLLQLWGFGHALLTNPANPVAVPRLISPDEQARREADTLLSTAASKPDH